MDVFLCSLYFFMFSYCLGIVVGDSFGYCLYCLVVLVLVVIGNGIWSFGVCLFKDFFGFVVWVIGEEISVGCSS